jgi:hypothetical protein
MTTLLEVLKEGTPASLVFFGAFADAKYLTIPVVIDDNRHQ